MRAFKEFLRAQTWCLCASANVISGELAAPRRSPKLDFFAFFCGISCIFQKNVVLLHPIWKDTVLQHKQSFSVSGLSVKRSFSEAIL